MGSDGRLKEDAGYRPLLMTPSQAQRMLGVGRTKVDQLIANGDLDLVRLDGMRMVRVTSVLKLAGELT